MSNETEQPWFGDLWFAIADYESHQLYEDILSPWLTKAKALMANLFPFQQLHRAPKDELEQGLWDLYALSRISDFLLLGFLTNLFKYLHLKNWNE